jgi:Flp pilus assembly pilin Flp
MKGRFLRRLLHDDSGQDLLEYGLLAAIIGIAGALLMPSIQAGMGTAFGNWGNDVYDLATPKDPGT